MALVAMSFPNYVLAMVMIRALATSSVTTSIANGGLMVSIHRQVTAALNGANNNFSILSDKAKHRKDSQSDDQTNWSLAELYKITEPVSAGRKAVIKRFVNDTYDLARQVDDTDTKLLKACLDNVKKLEDKSLEHHAVLLSQWTLRSNVPCRIFYELNKQEVLRLVALTQALLWHWEFPDLAILVTATDNHKNAVFNENNRRVRNEPMDRLEEVTHTTNPLR